MKLTKTLLKRLIKEELNSASLGLAEDEAGGAVTKEYVDKKIDSLYHVLMKHIAQLEGRR